MLRIILFALLGLYLIAVGVWPAAAAPIAAALAGLGVLAGLIPGPVLLLAGVAAWMKYRPAPVRPATA